MTAMNSPSRHQESDIYFIGVDSDGTVFDSMEIKHKRVFQPLAVEIWGLESYQESFNEIAETINLYSVHRGVNRFQGLIMAFERLVERIPKAAEALSGMTDLRAFVLSGDRLSAQALKDYQSGHRSAFLDKVLSWTERSDQRYAQIMDEEGNPPYRIEKTRYHRGIPAPGHGKKARDQYRGAGGRSRGHPPAPG